MRIARIIGATLVGLLFLANGCMVSSRPGSSSSTGSTNGVGSIYVSNASDNSILRFGNASGVNGNVTPSATISGPATTLATPRYLTVDSSDDRLFVANQGASAVIIFDNASTKNGDVGPNRTLTGPVTTLVAPFDVQVDLTLDLLYVADGANVVVFAGASRVNGDIAPVRSLAVGFIVTAMLLDSGNDRLFLADGIGNAINIYDRASTLNSTVNANRTISGSQTQLSSPAGLQIDNSGRLMVSNFSAPSITIYANAAIANGNVSPAASISGSNTRLTSPSQIAVEPSNGMQLFIADGASARILVYSNLSSANGNLAPTNDVSGPNTGLTTPTGLAADPKH